MASRCFGVSLLALCLICFGVGPLQGGQKTLEQYPKLPPQTLQKMRWLDRNGTPIWVGPPARRRQEKACKKGDFTILRKNWGLARDHLLENTVECPDFF